MVFTGCAKMIPTPSHPCPNVYCEQWSLAGIDVMICAETPEAAKAKVKALQAESVARSEVVQ